MLPYIIIIIAALAVLAYYFMSEKFSGMSFFVNCSMIPNNQLICSDLAAFRKNFIDARTANDFAGAENLLKGLADYIGSRELIKDYYDSLMGIVTNRGDPETADYYRSRAMHYKRQIEKLIR